MKPKILVITHLNCFSKWRKSLHDHMYSFSRYADSVDLIYFDATYGIPKFLAKMHYDGVILHYTFLSIRNDWMYFPEYFKKIKNLKYINAPKAAVPQDEYSNTKALWKMFKKFNVETVFSTAPKESLNVLYPPNKSGIKYRFSVLPGYVDETTLKRLKKKLDNNDSRPIDIGHRARKLPYWIGKHAQKKYEIGEVVKKYCQEYTSLICDISSNEEAVLEKESWIDFLIQCKALLGTEGGSQLWDFDSSIRKCVDVYVSSHPSASFKEVEAKCFPNQDGKLSYLKLTQRVFEAAMTKTCQILLEGHYSGMIKPDIHYIELKSDYSNLPEVIKKFQDEEFRNRIVENAYNDLIKSGKYTFRKFSNKIVDHLLGQNSQKTTKSYHGKNMFLPFTRNFKSKINKILIFLYTNAWNTRTTLNQWYWKSKRFLNYSFFRIVILPGTTVKQGLIKKELWPFKVSKQYMKNMRTFQNDLEEKIEANR